MKRTASILVAATTVLLIATSAMANWPWGYGGYLPGSDPGKSPPYFALYPPVYYAAPVAHTYGNTPYAAMPSSAPAPQVIVNPFVTDTAVNVPPGAVVAPLMKPQIVYPAAMAPVK
jgi:hypothetical protein